MSLEISLQLTSGLEAGPEVNWDLLVRVLQWQARCSKPIGIG